ncbi:molybdopterin converting factor [Acidihalobacter aeolianus]|uniref:Molybdopterin synthase catalytic subunit n=1 Tax=Acidihalobacter aeolianus TaxID=2792603 RepID=A0A1D8KBI8_9GAMM|nr:molybdopterin converting factor [Acidihalobacter aeolianus]
MVRLEESGFEPWAALAAYTAEHALDDGRAGATAVFVGSMRDFNVGDDVSEMFLEHYPGMTERELGLIVAEAEARWPLLDCLVVHRVGRLLPGEPIVLTAAWSAHRAAAFEACRHLMEALKHRAPFWKRETLADGSSRWVEQNTPG